MIQSGSDISRELKGEERLLWTGRPKQGIVFHAFDLFLIPFSLVWAGGAFTAFVKTFSRQLPTGPEGLVLIGMALVFFSVGVYLLLGRFLLDQYARRNTQYGVTDKRVIIVTKLINRKVKSLSLRSLTDISLVEKPNGAGTITFGSGGSNNAFGMMKGMQWPGMPQVPEFLLISNARSVYDIINDTQQQA